jgi:hypothetical protein
MRENKPLIFIPYVSITPSRIVSYTQVEGVNRKKKSVLPQKNTDVSLSFEPLLYHDLNDANPNDKQHYDWVQKMVDEKNAKIDLLNFEITQRNNEKTRLYNLTKDKYNGAISWAAKKRITTSINWLYALSEDKKFGYLNRQTFRLNMFTVTLPAKQQHTDDFIKKEMLNRLLEDMRRKYGLLSYIWRAEIQEKNTQNIHFHITTNIYIDKYEFRNLWNNVCNKYGYIDAFEAIHKHRNPNSTDVHSIAKITNLAAYLCKYMGKSTDKASRDITGRQWFLSSNLSKIKPIQLVEDSQIANEVYNFSIERKKYFKKYDYASISYADIFTGDLTNYPTLQYAKDKAIQQYKHLVN